MEIEKTRATGEAVEKFSTRSRWLNIGDALSRRWWRLDPNELSTETRRRTSLADFGDPTLEGRLAVLTRSIEREANLHPLGRFLARMHLYSLLETRLRLHNLWRRTEALDAKTIERPVFITGMPRSGSTFLHELFVQNTAHRAPLVWEVMYPQSVHDTIKGENKQSIKKAAACLWWFRRITPRADEVHPMRASSPQECIAIHSYSLLSQGFLTMFNIPSYEAYLNVADFTTAYQWQKRFLLHLQRHSQVKQWVLKAPDHIYSIESLFKVFPDAAIIQVHRDPVDVLKSSTQLIQVLRQTFAYPDNVEEIARREARALADGLDRITRFRDAHPELAGRFVDIHYRDIVSDPVHAVRWCHWQLGLSWSDETAERVNNLALTRARYPHKRKISAAKQQPLDLNSEAWRFERYCARFVRTSALKLK